MLRAAAERRCRSGEENVMTKMLAAISVPLLLLSVEWLSLLVLGLWATGIGLWLIVQIGEHGY